MPHSTLAIDPPGAWAAPVAAWLTTLKSADYSGPTRALRRQHVTQFAVHAGHDDPWSVTLEDLERWLSANAWKPETRYSHRSSLKSFYAWARHRGYIADDPAAGLRRIRRPIPKSRAVPRTLVVAALKTADERTALILRLAGEHGLRRAEIAQVHTRDVFQDLHGYSLTVHGKGRKTRNLPLADDVAEAILDAEGYAFPGQIDGHLSAEWIGKLVRRVLPAGWTTHTLRHRFATDAFADSHNLFAVQRALGHSSAATTQRYVEIPDDDIRQLIRAVRIVV